MQKFQPTTPKSDKVVISIRLESSKLEAIDAIASKIRISRNELIGQCLDYALKNIDFEPRSKSKKS
ncbi:MAG: CopG family transcriptional regulator [Oscillospiraceae bacterium]|nr:CopG family transcriptional regulator [Oscillospiraceae bacterium]